MDETSGVGRRKPLLVFGGPSRRQVFDVDVDEAGRGIGVEDDGPVSQPSCFLSGAPSRDEAIPTGPGRTARAGPRTP